jgi:hypothetical protein
MAGLIDLSGKSRSYLTRKLNQMELPETDSRDFDDEHILQILLQEGPDLYFDSRDSAKKKTKKSKKVATAQHGGLAKRGYGVARRG